MLTGEDGGQESAISLLNDDSERRTWLELTDAVAAIKSLLFDGVCDGEEKG